MAFLMSIELPRPSSDPPVHRIEYVTVTTIAEATAWVKRPPSSLRLRQGYLVTARDDTWPTANVDGGKLVVLGIVTDDKRHIAICGDNAITLGKKPINAKLLGMPPYKTELVDKWGTLTAHELMEQADGIDLRTIVRAAVALAKTAKCYMNHDTLKALRIAEAWCDGKATAEEADEAAKEAWVDGDDIDDMTATQAASKAAYYAGSIIIDRYYITFVCQYIVGAYDRHGRYGDVVREHIKLYDVLFVLLTKG